MNRKFQEKLLRYVLYLDKNIFNNQLILEGLKRAMPQLRERNQLM